MTSSHGLDVVIHEIHHDGEVGTTPKDRKVHPQSRVSGLQSRAEDMELR